MALTVKHFSVTGCTKLDESGTGCMIQACTLFASVSSVFIVKKCILPLSTAKGEEQGTVTPKHVGIYVWAAHGQTLTTDIVVKALKARRKHDDGWHTRSHVVSISAKPRSKDVWEMSNVDDTLLSDCIRIFMARILTERSLISFRQCSVTRFRWRTVSLTVSGWIKFVLAPWCANMSSLWFVFHWTLTHWSEVNCTLVLRLWTPLTHLGPSYELENFPQWEAAAVWSQHSKLGSNTLTLWMERHLGPRNKRT